MTTTRVFRSRAVVTPDDMAPGTVHVQDGVIVRVGSFDDVPVGKDVVELGEVALLPGLVDTHVHINEPGRTEWEGFRSATRAAAAGGVTTLVDMPLNAIPPTTSVAGLEAKRAAASGQLHVDVGFWGGVVPGNVAELEPLWRAGVFGFKAFLSPSGVDEFQAVAETDLRTALPVLASLGAPLLVHAESPDVLAQHLSPPTTTPDEARRYATWASARPPDAEQAAIAMLLRLAAEFGARVHVVHLATAAAIEMLESARQRGAQVTVETCPHYLHFDSAAIPDGGTEFKCAPPIRDRTNREALWYGLRSGAIDLVATDHSPCPPALKRIETGNFLEAWGGIASLQLGLAIIWTNALARGFSIRDVVRWMSEGPARLAGLSTRGAIAPGCRADLVAFDPDVDWVVDPSELFHRHPITPYAGACLTGRVKATFLAGSRVSVDEGVPPNGRVLTRPG
ncbi:MAG: allantoinase AllB [Gemmatimonadaceae bacterium]